MGVQVGPEYAGTSILTIHSSGRPYLRDFYDDETSQAVLAFLLKQDQIKTIILSHLGVEMTQGDAPTLSKEQVLLNPDYALGLKKTVRAFQATGKRVIWMGSIPILDFDPKRCLARPFAQNRLPGRCIIPREEIMRTHRSYLSVMQNFRAEFPKLEIIDAMDYLCDSQRCYAKRNDLILYADKKHLNFLGSAIVTKPLIALIDRGSPK
jgi:hypothetical protein